MVVSLEAIFGGQDAALEIRPMSGRKQHFIPQSLLKGFGVQRGKSVYVVAYTYDRGIFSPATDGIAAERHFYSELSVDGEVETLDDRITSYETPFAMMLARLRGLGDGEAADAGEAAELATHLAIRNDNFRKAMTETGITMMLHAAGAASQADRLRRMFGVDGDAPSPFFATKLTEAYQQRRDLLSQIGMDEAAFNAGVFSMLKENFDTYHQEIGTEFAMFLATLVGEMPTITADAQRGSLEKTLAPEERVARMKTYAWRVEHRQEPLILPDCVTLGYDADGNVAPLMLTDLSALETIYLPLATNRLLIGYRGEAGDIPADLNAVLAGCSWDFFVTRDRTPEFEALRDSLRSRVAGHLDDIVEQSVASSLLEDDGSI